MNHTKKERWSRVRLVTLTFYTACAVRVTILVLAKKSALFQFLRTCFYSSCLILCALDEYNYTVLSNLPHNYIHVQGFLVSKVMVGQD